ncbi:hypothetical protein NC652_004856 [Populus alba x Populus x berolinensis]|nr:hypothetical protein NC652_004856 [Populus alba x Populus x berolinensis]
MPEELIIVLILDPQGVIQGPYRLVLDIIAWLEQGYFGTDTTSSFVRMLPMDQPFHELEIVFPGRPGSSGNPLMRDVAAQDEIVHDRLACQWSELSRQTLILGVLNQPTWLLEWKNCKKKVNNRIIYLIPSQILWKWVLSKSPSILIELQFSTSAAAGASTSTTAAGASTGASAAGAYQQRRQLELQQRRQVELPTTAATVLKLQQQHHLLPNEQQHASSVPNETAAAAGSGTVAAASDA